jgi:hypothetical protein
MMRDEMIKNERELTDLSATTERPARIAPVITVRFSHQKKVTTKLPANPGAIE